MRQHHNKGKQFGKPFQPGQSGNPIGISALGVELQRLELECLEGTRELLFKYQNLSREQLAEIISSPKSTVRESYMARMFSKAIGGSYQHLTEILNRSIGPIPKHVKIDDDSGAFQIPLLEGFTAETLTAVMIQLKREAEAIECSTQTSPVSSPESPAQFLPPASSTES